MLKLKMIAGHHSRSAMARSKVSSQPNVRSRSGSSRNASMRWIAWQTVERSRAKGYDAALRDAESLAEERQGDVGMTVVMAPGAGKSGAAARLAKGFKPRLTPGLADKLVREALEKVAPREVTATEILHTIKNDLGTIMGFSTMRRSLTRLNQIGHAAYDADTQLWSLATKGSANTKLRSIKG
jgi:hypothetical protein